MIEQNNLNIIIKYMRKNIEQYQPKYTKLSDLGSHFGTICVMVCGPGAFFRDLFFGTSGGTPLGRFWLPWDTLGPILLTFCKFRGASLLQISKIPEQQITPTTLSNIQARINKTLYRQSTQANRFLLLLLNQAA